MQNEKRFAVTTHNLDTDNKYTVKFNLYSHAIDHYRSEAKNAVEDLTYFSGSVKVTLQADIPFSKEIIISAAYDTNQI